MNYTIKMTSKGQITLPKEIRDKMGIDFGTYLRVQENEGSIILKPVSRESMLIKEYAEKYSKEAHDTIKLREAIGQLPVNMTEYIKKIREEDSEKK